MKTVTPGYFETIGLAPVAGRLPDERDAGAAVLSESAARALFPDGNVIGGTFRLQYPAETRTVVAVVPDIRSRSALVVDVDRPDVYVLRGSDGARWQWPPVVVVRPVTGGPAFTDQIRRAANTIGPPVIVERIRSGTDWFDDNLQETRNRTLLLGLIGSLGVTLALVGVFSTTAYAVAHRTHEVGVRMAFGARPADVVGRMVRDAAWPIIIGAAGGVAGAYYAARFIESFLYDTPPREPVTFAVVAAIMVAIAFLAAWIPARRAAQVDPVVALRAE